MFGKKPQSQTHPKQRSSSPRGAARQTARPGAASRARSRRSRLDVESLEGRVLLSSAPFITSVTPPDGAVLTGPTSSKPPIVITFSQAMVALDADNVANYLLFSSAGNKIPITQANYQDVNATTHQVTLTYTGNFGTPPNDILTVDKYSLFVRGDQIHDVADGLALAAPGELLVANSGLSNNALAGTQGNANAGYVSAPGDGNLHAISNYPEPLPPTLTGSVAANPNFVALADLNGLKDSKGNPINDLIVLDTANDAVNIFQGQPGGGFALGTPTAVLSLPTGAGGSALVVADFNGDGRPDIAVADKTLSKVSVFLNKGTASGGINFQPAPINVAAGANPVALVAADFNLDGKMDLAVADNGATSKNYDVTFLFGDGTGHFPKNVAVAVGSTTPSGLVSPTGLALADFNQDNKPDLAVSGSTGVIPIINTSTTTAFSFNTASPGLLATSNPATSVAVGNLAGTSFQDIAVTTDGSGGQVLIFPNSGTTGTTFGPAQPFSSGPSPRGITLADVNGDGLTDILVANAVIPDVGSPATFSVLVNNNSGGSLSFAPPVSYKVDGQPLSLAVADTNQDGAVDVVTANSSAQDVSLALGNLASAGVPDGTFGVSTDIPAVGTQPSAVASGDLNGDGLPDYVIADQASNTVTVLLANPGSPGSFTTTTYAVGLAPVAVALARLTGSTGPLDIVVANQNDNTLTILGNDGTGNFPGGLTSTVSVGAFPTGLAVGDFNNDGKLDLAVAHDSATGGSGGKGVTLLLGNGDRTFQSPREVITDGSVDASAVAVGDFNHDGNLDLVVADNKPSGRVALLFGNGDGSFKSTLFYSAVDSPGSLAVADVNGDGFPDVIVGSTSTNPSNGNLAVLFNTAGTGLSSIPITTTILGGNLGQVAIQSIAVTNVNQGPFPDLVVTVNQEVDTTQTPPAARNSVNNVFALLGNGNGTFKVVPYLVGGAPTTAGGSTNDATPSFVAIGSDPLIRLSTFQTGGKVVTTDLIRNGTFEVPDLTGASNTLNGWQTSALPGSAGQWSSQTGTTSPLSQQAMDAPQETGGALGGNAAVLDEADPFPLTEVTQAFGANPGNTNPTPPPIASNASYAGTHFLYQDMFIPASASSVTLTMSLYIDNTGSETGTSGGGVNPGFFAYGNGLNYQDTIPNQQVRVDIVNPTAPLTATNADSPGNPGVLLPVYITPLSGTTDLLHYFTITVPSSSLLPFAGRQGGIRLRIATVNNSGKLIVAADNVHLFTTFTDNSSPGLFNLKLRNPSFGVSPSSGGFTSDPTIVGQVISDQNALSSQASPNNISYIAIDVANDGNFNGPNAFRITNWDPQGNFTATLTNFIPNLLPGPYTIGVQAVDKAGNAFTTTFSFVYNGPSTSSWSAQGPGPISTAGQGVQYPNVSGEVTATVVDPRDPSGNTLYIGSANGGVWRTTDGGNDWTPLTDHVTDALGNPVAVPIGSLALGVTSGTNTGVLYAGLGVADLAPDHFAGAGILKSTDNGLTWQLLGAKYFTGARIAKVLVDPNNTNVVYVGVASGGLGQGVWGSGDGGVTWTQLLTSASLGGLPVPSVTDLIMNPFNSEDLTVGLGNIGLVPSSAAAGVWATGNAGGNWTALKGNTDPRVLNDALPSGASVGRVTLAQGSANQSVQNYLYVLVASPPPAATRGVADYGSSFGSNQQGPNSPGSKGIYGLYRSKDAGANWTHVMLRENVPTPTLLENYLDINLLGHDGANAGALLVDPANANIVLVGGSGNFSQPGDSTSHPLHSLLYVDTSNMRDTTFVDPLVPNVIPNDGDDIDKVIGAEIAGQTTGKGKEYLADSKAYLGEGSFWFDLVQDSPETSTFGINLLPNSIHSLTFDSQGRLLVGTSGGLFRSSVLSFNYDFTSGNSFSMMAEDFSLNGNLQIADLTGIAIDPQNAHRLYISGMNIGTALGTGSSFGTFNWSSMALASLNTTILPSSGYGPILSAGAVWASAPPPGSPGGSPTTVYQVWRFADPKSSLEVEVSNQNGAPGTFKVENAGIASLTDTAAAFPPLVLNPVKTIQNNQAQDELMFGTNTVYEADTGANHWDNVVSTPTRPSLSSTGGVVTALAFAPSAKDAFYAGTDKGEVFVDLNDGLQGWPNRSAGLPGARINGIAVDPNNANVAYVAVAGQGIAHVWKTTNAGVSWISLGAGLPDVPAYSLAVVDGPVPGSLVGNLYVGTQVGVYVLVGQTGTWQRLGQGLPNVPVVDLQYNPTFKTLAIATQGRGAFEISIDVSGPQVASITPSTPVSAPLTTVTVTFNKAIDPRSFNIGADIAARATVANSLLQSSEYRSNLVTSYYTRFLLRTPSAAEVSPWVNQLAQGVSDETVIANFVGSPEYFQNPQKGNNSNSTWVNAIYHDLVGRAPTGLELSQAQSDLATQSRTSVAFNDLLNTTTYQNYLVTGFFNTLLRRTPTASELAGFVSGFSNLPPITDEKIISALISSVEYYANNGSLTAVTANASAPQLVPGAMPSAVALADIDGDGTPDLIVANAGNDTVNVYQGLAGGGFNLKPIVLTLPTGAAPTALVVGNFSGGALPDIAVANGGLASATANSLSLFQNTSTTKGVVSFAARTDFDAGNHPVGLATADFNGDQVPDLAVVDGAPDATNHYNVNVFLGTGAATLLLPSTIVNTGFTSAPTGIAAGDLNGDNIPDLVASGKPGLSVLINDASKVFATTAANVLAVQVGSTNVGTNSVAIGQIDTSGRNAIVATTRVGGGDVLVLQNLGGANPTFSAPTVVSAGSAPGAVTLKDLNGDGLNDILVVNDTSPGGLTVLRNTTVHASSGQDSVTFAASVTYPVGNLPLGLALADTNGDRVLDVATANSGGDSVSVLLGNANATFQMPSDPNFVNQAYRDVLGRPADNSGLAAFVSSLAAAEQVRLITPAGTTAPLALTNPAGDDTTWQLTFAPQVVDGTYTLILGPNSLGLTIKDFIDSGHPLDQDGDQSNGQQPGDGFNGPIVINSSDDGQFITGMYHDLLNRVADTTGFLGFLGPIDGARGQAVSSTATAFLNSAENLGNFIRRLFSSSDPLAVGSYLAPVGNFLHRLASNSDVNSLVQAFQSGVTEEQLMSGILASPEYFQNRAGNSNSAWVAAAYQDVLGRGITGDSGAQNFINLLNSNQLNRSQVANSLLGSAEYRARIIQGTYLAFLGRLPGAAEIAGWQSTLAQPRNGTGLSADQKFVLAVLTSFENFFRAGNTNASWLTTLYSRLLGRTPDTNGFSSNLGGLMNAYQSQRQQALSTVLGSTEYRNDLVTGYYQTYLHRAVTPSELSTQVGGLAAGVRDEQVIAGIVASAEYFQNVASGQNAQFIQHAYLDLLFRSSSNDPGAQNFLNALNNSTMTRSQVATSLVGSNEYRTDLVAKFYNTYLGRNFPLPAPSNSPELNGWANALASGLTDEQVLAMIMSSPEYFNRPHQYP
jgi:hypothetical protein